MELALSKPQEKKKTIPEISYESQVVYSRLKTLMPDDFVSYSELSELIGRNIQMHRTHLTTAIRRCLNDAIVIKAVRNQGVKRLKDDDIIHISGSFAKYVRRGASRVRREITSVDYSHLSQADQVTHNARLSQYGAMSFFSTDHNLKRIEQKVDEIQKQLPIGKTLQLFGSSA